MFEDLLIQNVISSLISEYMNLDDDDSITILYEVKFSSVFSSVDGRMGDVHDEFNSSYLNCICINKVEIKYSLESLSYKLGDRPDNLPVFLSS